MVDLEAVSVHVHKWMSHSIGVPQMEYRYVKTADVVSDSKGDVHFSFPVGVIRAGGFGLNGYAVHIQFRGRDVRESCLNLDGLRGFIRKRETAGGVNPPVVNPLLAL